MGRDNNRHFGSLISRFNRSTSGAAAKAAAERKELKYAELSRSLFVPVACETLGPFNTKALSFLSDLGKRMSTATGDSRESSFLFQCLSIALQRFNSVCFQGSFIYPGESEG